MDPTSPVAPSSPDEGVEPPIPELIRLGEQLGRARQNAGLSTDDLAGRLRLAPRQLKALEEGDHARLPEGVFVVALARRIAGALNADLEEAIQAVRESRLMRRAQEGKPAPAAAPREAWARSDAPMAPVPPASTPTPPAPRASKPGAPGPWRWPLAALLAVGVLGCAWLLVSRPNPRGASSGSPTPDSPPGAPAPPSTPTPTAEDNTLRLSASEPSWVEVREVMGRTLFEGTLTGEKRFPIGRGLEVISGRPHAVRAAVGAGDSAPLGGVSDIRWKRFTPGAPPPAPPSSPSPSP